MGSSQASIGKHWQSRDSIASKTKNINAAGTWVTNSVKT